MKTNCWLVLGLLLAMSARAQDNTNMLPPPPAPEVTPAPAPETAPPAEPPAPPAKHKKPAPKRAPLVEPTVALLPGPAEVVVSNLNVRGQAGLHGDFITHVTKGETVTVLEQITLDKHSPDEPAQWAKIILPADAHVWVSAMFIDATNKTVLPKKLNVRAGPSELYNVLGVIERGEPVNEIKTQGDWMQIDAPSNAYAFVAAMYLKQEASGTMATNVPPSTETEPTNTTVEESAPIVSEPTNTPAPEPEPAPAPAPEPAPAPPVVAPVGPEPEPVQTNLPPRIVTHEGVVRHVKSIIEPTDYEIYDPKTGEAIDYLYSTSTNLDLSRYNGLRIIVTGEEGLTDRWKNTPVLTIQRIQVVE